MADINKLFDTINKSMGRTIVSNILDVKAIAPLATCRMDTGSVAINTITGGGIPKGYVTEYVGHESSGKTSLALMQAGITTRNGGHVAFIDIEGGFKTDQSIEYLQRFGIVLDHFHLVVPKWKEEAIDAVEALIVSKQIELIIYDSIAADLASRQVDREASDKGVGIEAKLNTLLLKKVKSSMQPLNLNDPDDKPWCAFIFTNQLRDVIGMSGPMQSQPKGAGGWALKHLKDISIEFKRTHYLGPNGEEVNTTSSETKSDKDMIYGQTIKLMVRKNKTWFPFIVTTVDYYFKERMDGIVKQNGIDSGKEIFTLGNVYNTFDKCGTQVFFNIKTANWFQLDDVNKNKTPIFDETRIKEKVVALGISDEEKQKMEEDIKNLQYPLYTKDGLDISKIDNNAQLKAAFMKGQINLMYSFIKSSSLKETTEILATNEAVRKIEIEKIYDLAINQKKTELLFDNEVKQSVIAEEALEAKVLNNKGSNTLFTKQSTPVAED